MQEHTLGMMRKEKSELAGVGQEEWLGPYLQVGEALLLDACLVQHVHVSSHLVQVVHLPGGAWRCEI